MAQQEKQYYFNGEISPYGIENNRVDYHALAQNFQHVLWNAFQTILTEYTYSVEVECGNDHYYYANVNGETKEYTQEEYDNLSEEEQDNCEIEYIEFYQFFMVSSNAIEYLKEANECVFYCDSLDCYVWGVSHFGTSWEYVLTDIKIDKNKD